MMSGELHGISEKCRDGVYDSVQVNFNFSSSADAEDGTEAFKMQEVRAYFLIIASAIGIITVNTVSLCGNALQAFQDAAFRSVRLSRRPRFILVVTINGRSFQNDYGTFDVYQRLRGVVPEVVSKCHVS